MFSSNYLSLASFIFFTLVKLFLQVSFANYTHIFYFSSLGMSTLSISSSSYPLLKREINSMDEGSMSSFDFLDRVSSPEPFTLLSFVILSLRVAIKASKKHNSKTKGKGKKVVFVTSKAKRWDRFLQTWYT